MPGFAQRDFDAGRGLGGGVVPGLRPHRGLVVQRQLQQEPSRLHVSEGPGGHEKTIIDALFKSESNPELTVSPEVWVS